MGYQQSKEDKRFFNSRAWKGCRLSVLSRDNYKCGKCGKPATEVHHDPPRFRLEKKQWTNPKYCVAICKSCHSSETQKEYKEIRNERDRVQNRPTNEGWLTV